MWTWQETEINRRGTLFHFFPVWHYFFPSTNSKLVCSSYSSFFNIGKDSDAGRDWGQEENGTTEGEMAGWHH